MHSIDGRPTKFSEMIGHKVMIKEMKKFSTDMSFPEVMLFEGESGTGKTTLAFIIAALLNDTNPIKNPDGTQDPNPESPTFSDIYEQRFALDVRFYNAAKMGKDEILGLESVLSTMPWGNKKIIIIDEAQEISKAGKGAALALLEKKRKNVHLILCTMDIEAFDKAVRSRCQSYKFKSPTSTEIAEYLFGQMEFFPNHDKAPEDFISEGLFTIADACDGSVRLAVQMLQRAMSAEIFSAKEIIEEFGMVSNKAMAEIFAKLSMGDPSVFQDLKGLDMKELFYKMNKAITSAAVYQVSGYSDEAWKIGLAKSLIASPYFDLLQETFYNIDKDCAAYFRPTVFSYHMAKFMGKVSKSMVVTPVHKMNEPLSRPTREPAAASTASRSPVIPAQASRAPVGSA